MVSTLPVSDREPVCKRKSNFPQMWSKTGFSSIFSSRKSQESWGSLCKTSIKCLCISYWPPLSPALPPSEGYSFLFRNVRIFVLAVTKALRAQRTVLCSLSKSPEQAGLLGLQELSAPCKVGMRVSGGLCEDKIKPLLAHMAWTLFSQSGPLHMAGVQQIFTDWGVVVVVN